jgi:hypothetical protein
MASRLNAAEVDSDSCRSATGTHDASSTVQPCLEIMFAGEIYSRTDEAKLCIQPRLETLMLDKVFS